MTYTLEINVPPTIYEKLAVTAQSTGQTIEAIALEWIQKSASIQVHDSFDAMIGTIHSNGSDWLDAHDEYLGQQSDPK